VALCEELLWKRLLTCRETLQNEWMHECGRKQSCGNIMYYPRHLPGATEGDHEEVQSRLSVLQPRFELGTTRGRFRRDTAV